MQKRTNIKCAAHNFYSSRKLFDLKGLLTKNRLQISTKDMQGLERLNSHQHHLLNYNIVTKKQNKSV